MNMREERAKRRLAAMAQERKENGDGAERGSAAPTREDAERAAALEALYRKQLAAYHAARDEARAIARRRAEEAARANTPQPAAQEKPAAAQSAWSAMLAARAGNGGDAARVGNAGDAARGGRAAAPRGFDAPIRHGKLGVPTVVRHAGQASEVRAGVGAGDAAGTGAPSAPNAGGQLIADKASRSRHAASGARASAGAGDAGAGAGDAGAGAGDATVTRTPKASSASGVRGASLVDFTRAAVNAGAAGAAVQGTAASEPAPHGASAQGAAARGASAYGASAHGATASAPAPDGTSAHDTSAHDTSAHNTSAHGSSAHGSSAHDASAHGATASALAPHDTSAHDTSVHNTSAPDTSAQGTPLRAPAPDVPSSQTNAPHPPAFDPADWESELAHFDETRGVIDEEIGKLEVQTGAKAGVVTQVFVDGDGTNESDVEFDVLRSRLLSLNQLHLSRSQPFFARLDFVPEGGAPETCYIGRWGVTKTPEYVVRVADWRSPIANLYYSGQLGTVDYDAPDGAVRGTLSRKRLYDVEDGKLLGASDTVIGGQDRLLTEALSKVTGSRLREIVTTIQAEQNAVIRFPPNRALIVQGVAGSGKTTIALHRVAWLLYARQGKFLPQNLLILAPNPLFLRYISRVLPDLGVDDVRQTTFALLAARLMGSRAPRLAAANRLEERLKMTAAERAALDATLRWKGSLETCRALEAYLDAFEQSCVPTGDVCFARRTLLSGDDVRRMFLKELAAFPLAMRVPEIRKVLRARLNAVCGEIEGVFRRKTDERIDQITRKLPDGEQRRALAWEALDARDARLAELSAAKKAFLPAWEKTWKDMRPMALYAAFLGERGAEAGLSDAAREETLALLSRGKALPEDLPALWLCDARAFGHARWNIKHVLIDEAQDFSPFMLRVLRAWAGHGAFTLVGDLMQGVHGDEGLRDWREAMDARLLPDAELHLLSTSYRSTVEIMKAAFAVIARHPVAGVRLAEPVLRHGEAPVMLGVRGEKERVDAVVELVRVWRAAGYFSIALIERTEKDAGVLRRAVEKALGEKVALLSAEDEEYAGGVMVMPAAMVKGLEFDCVAVCDVSAKAFEDDAFHARLLYVLSTRPLHRLAYIWAGERTALLAGMDDKVTR